jgi:DNA-binding HxlR family transcriptional regulator
MQPASDYCSYTKAVEHLGDRWMLLILREVGLHAPIGFNALVASLPGISRSVLARRLRKLEIMGLIARAPSVRGQPAPYRLAPAGQQLAPTLFALSQWAEQWVPEDPEVANHDPDVITFWLTLRADPSALPDRPAVLVFDTGDRHVPQQWLVLERGSAPSMCLEDPLLPDDRYIHVEAGPDALFPIARGLRDWPAAVADRSVRLFGDPSLIRELPSWFLPVAVPAADEPARALSAV